MIFDLIFDFASLSSLILSLFYTCSYTSPPSLFHSFSFLFFLPLTHTFFSFAPLCRVATSATDAVCGQSRRRSRFFPVFTHTHTHTTHTHIHMYTLPPFFSSLCLFPPPPLLTPSLSLSLLLLLLSAHFSLSAHSLHRNVRLSSVTRKTI